MEKMKLFNLYIFSNVFGRAGVELDSRISISFFFFLISPVIFSKYISDGKI